MSREILTLKSALASAEVDGVGFATIEDRLTEMDCKILNLVDTN